MHGHERADARNLHLHRAALERLAADPALRAPCLRLVEAWLAAPDHPATRWLATWREMLAAWPIERIQDVVLDETGGQTLRQCSPLGPALTPKERWRLLEEANRAFDARTVPTP